MKKVRILIALLSFSSLASYADTADFSSGSSCGVFVKTIYSYVDDYRYHLVDAGNHNIGNSNSESFTSKAGSINGALRMSFLLNKSVCIKWNYRANDWTIESVVMEKF